VCFCQQCQAVSLFATYPELSYWLGGFRPRLAASSQSLVFLQLRPSVRLPGKLSVPTSAVL